MKDITIKEINGLVEITTPDGKKHLANKVTFERAMRDYVAKNREQLEKDLLK